MVYNLHKQYIAFSYCYFLIKIVRTLDTKYNIRVEGWKANGKWEKPFIILPAQLEGEHSPQL